MIDSAMNEGFISAWVPTNAFEAVGLIAIIQDDGTPKPHCTGTVIGRSTVAHCGPLCGTPRNLAECGFAAASFMIGSAIGSATPIVVDGSPRYRTEKETATNLNSLNERTIRWRTILPFSHGKADRYQCIALYAGSPNLNEIVNSRTQVDFVDFGINPWMRRIEVQALKRQARIPLANPDNRTFLLFSWQEGWASTCYGDSGGPALLKERKHYLIVGRDVLRGNQLYKWSKYATDVYREWISPLHSVDGKSV
jgi:hypothetical protein